MAGSRWPLHVPWAEFVGSCSDLQNEQISFWGRKLVVRVSFFPLFQNQTSCDRVFGASLFGAWNIGARAGETNPRRNPSSPSESVWSGAVRVRWFRDLNLGVVGDARANCCVKVEQYQQLGPPVVPCPFAPFRGRVPLLK